MTTNCAGRGWLLLFAFGSWLILARRAYARVNILQPSSIIRLFLRIYFLELTPALRAMKPASSAPWLAIEKNSGIRQAVNSRSCMRATDDNQVRWQNPWLSGQSALIRESSAVRSPRPNSRQPTLRIGATAMSIHRTLLWERCGSVHITAKSIYVLCPKPPDHDNFSILLLQICSSALDKNQEPKARSQPLKAFHIPFPRHLPHFPAHFQFEKRGKNFCGRKPPFQLFHDLIDVYGFILS